ncbi:type II secretion system GspH family protein [Patescibacteria group bacterium]|nr:type II secretion system GspH family protein [Patescibacteria group bacterium]MBU1876843.1 type II secretion system GspH family protein [Patescibacteria group bacterium]
MEEIKQKGFTLIELLVVIAIIGMLSSIVLVSLGSARKKAMDAKRLQDMKQLTLALQMYYDKYEKYPDNTDLGDVGCWGNWEAGNIVNGPTDPFIKPLEDEGLIKTPLEVTNIRDGWNSQCIYRYGKYTNPCCGCSGTYAVLYAACETANCPVNERPACCTCWGEGAGALDPYDIVIFLKE